MGVVVGPSFVGGAKGPTGAGGDVTLAEATRGRALLAAGRGTPLAGATRGRALPGTGGGIIFAGGAKGPVGGVGIETVAGGDGGGSETIKGSAWWDRSALEVSTSPGCKAIAGRRQL